MSRRQLLSVVSALIIGICLLQFQNCAPAKSGSTTTEGDSGVNLVDDLSKVEIQFGDSSIEVQDAVDAVNISGLCNRNRNGAKLRWAVWDGANSSKPLVWGESTCKAGQFSFKLEGLQDFVCGIPNMLVVEGDWGGASQVKFMRRCQALVSQALPANVDDPYGTVCALEYAPAGDSACTRVCFRDDKVISKDEMAAGMCSSLAASLTGQ